MKQDAFLGRRAGRETNTAGQARLRLAARVRPAVMTGLLLLIAGLLVACGASTAPAGQEATGSADRLLVFDWPGYDPLNLWNTFAEQYPDVKVDTTYFEQDPDAIAKLQSGFKVDVFHPCSNWWGLYVENGLVQPIDTSRLSNWPNVLPELAKLGEFDGVQYFIPYDWGYESILVRTDKIDEIPTSWADLWNPAYAGHLSIPDMAETVFAAAALALGIEDPWNTTPEQDEAIKQKLIELKPSVLTYWVDTTELGQMMASGDVWIASNVWQDTYSTLIEEGVPVEYIQPQEGRLGWICGYGISSQSQNVDLAHAYLDARLAPESIVNLSNDLWYGGSNQAAFDLIDPEVQNFFELDDPNVLEDTRFYKTMSEADRQKITTLWDEVKLAP